MSDQDVQGAIDDVIRAVEGLNRAFDEKAKHLREAGNEEKLREWLKGCLALRDSGDMYVSWAQHYAKQGGEAGSTEEEEFLDEGAAWDGPPSNPAS